MVNNTKPILDLRSQARSHTAMSLRTLVGIAKSPKCPPMARVVAANSLLDRGWGKPDQVHASPDGGPIQVIIRHIVENQLVDNTEINEPVVIEHDPGCDR